MSRPASLQRAEGGQGAASEPASGAGRPGIGAFVRRKRAGWERLAALTARLGSGALGLEEVEELDRLYRRAVGDLAWARAAYPGSDVEGYLSQVTARSYAALYRRRSRPGRLRAFVREEIPAAFARHRRLFALSAALLLGGIAAGALAVALDPAAAATLVPRPVRSAVAVGRMWTDSLLEVAPGFTGSFIARNNIAVIGLAFALGLTGGLGTAWLLFSNGLLLGPSSPSWRPMGRRSCSAWCWRARPASSWRRPWWTRESGRVPRRCRRPAGRRRGCSPRWCRSW
jgi:hypothetical protein